MRREHYSLSVNRIPSVQMCAEAMVQAGLEGGSFAAHLCWRYGTTPRDYVLHEHSVLQMPPGASWHLYLLSVEQALHSDLCEKQDCRTSCTQDKPHSAAPPRAHLESGDFLQE